jgi:hypothetical protein
MLRGISSIAGFRDLYPHFDSINSKLSVYEKLKDSPALLELAIWKSKIIEQTEGNVDLLTIDMKMAMMEAMWSMVTKTAIATAVIRTTRTMRVMKMTRKMTMVKAKAMRTNISVT